MTTARRQASERSGRRSEFKALWMLRLKGYRLLARRFKCPLGEIDLIMRKGQTTAFIEALLRNHHAKIMEFEKDPTTGCLEIY